jgi:hypothetical protein
MTGAEYVAGLWLSQIPFNLCWAVKWDMMDTRRVSRSTEHYVPSWSWASMHGAFSQYYYQDANPDDSLLWGFDIEATPVGENPYGDVKEGAAITLVGYAATAKLRLRLRSDGSPRSDNRSLPTKVLDPAIDECALRAPSNEVDEENDEDEDEDDDDEDDNKDHEDHEGEDEDNKEEDTKRTPQERNKTKELRNEEPTNRGDNGQKQDTKGKDSMSDDACSISSAGGTSPPSEAELIFSVISG